MKTSIHTSQLNTEDEEFRNTIKTKKNMKPRFTVIFVIASFMLITLGACSSSEDLIPSSPHLSQLQNTGCLDSGFGDFETENDDFSTFEMKIEGKTAECFFNSLKYPCDFENVNVIVTYENETMTIIEYPSSDLADCICDVDVSFQIEDLPEGNFILKIFRANTNGEYNKDYPKLTETINVKDGSYNFPYY
ncbi:MAG: hypothetical protein K2M37_06915 [Muribaculaceae bacterium]|nr:hypothetical protein [Muribaculaceae bacterium]